MEAHWRPIYIFGALGAFFSLAIIPGQVVAFIMSPPPESAAGFFALFEKNILMGLVSLDLLYLLNNVVNLILIPALCLSLWRVNRSIALVALILGLSGTIAFFSSSTVFNMMYLYERYAESAVASDRNALIAAGEAMLSVAYGTAYHLHYVLGTIALLLVSALMLKSPFYSNATAVVGLATNFLAFGLYVPVIGDLLSALSGLGYVAWFIMIGVALLRLGRTVQHHGG